jgi:5-hydroxyisourate hydrolase
VSPITTHVLDTAKGQPAAGISITLEKDSDGWKKVGAGVTDEDGRVKDLLPEGSLELGLFRITFVCGPYLEKNDMEGFYTNIPIEFHVKNTNQHYHVPLLLNPFGYSTYRGS